MLIARIYEVFALLCPMCGGQMGLIAFITHSAEIRHILKHIGVECEPPHITPARGPPAPSLEKAASDFLAKTRAMLCMARLNFLYVATYFEPTQRPTRTCIGVNGLTKGASIEIDTVARRPEKANGQPSMHILGTVKA